MNTTIILTLATWRISSLLVNEMGPYDIFETLRYRLGVRYDERSVRYGNNEIAKLFVCVWCLSVWVGSAWATLWGINENMAKILALPFALSAGAVVVEKATNG